MTEVFANFVAVVREAGGFPPHIVGLLTLPISNLDQTQQFKDYGKMNDRIGGMTALAKGHGSQVCEFVLREASQIFGGLSYTRGGVGGKVERLYREVRQFAIPAGSEEVMLGGLEWKWRESGSCLDLLVPLQHYRLRGPRLAQEGQAHGRQHLNALWTNKYSFVRFYGMSERISSPGQGGTKDGKQRTPGWFCAAEEQRISSKLTAKA